MLKSPLNSNKLKPERRFRFDIYQAKDLLEMVNKRRIQDEPLFTFAKAFILKDDGYMLTDEFYERLSLEPAGRFAKALGIAQSTFSLKKNYYRLERKKRLMFDREQADTLLNLVNNRRIKNEKNFTFDKAFKEVGNENL